MSSNKLIVKKLTKMLECETDEILLKVRDLITASKKNIPPPEYTPKAITTSIIPPEEIIDYQALADSCPRGRQRGDEWDFSNFKLWDEGEKELERLKNPIIKSGKWDWTIKYNKKGKLPKLKKNWKAQIHTDDRVWINGEDNIPQEFHDASWKEKLYLQMIHDGREYHPTKSHQYYFDENKFGIHLEDWEKNYKKVKNGASPYIFSKTFTKKMSKYKGMLGSHQQRKTHYLDKWHYCLVKLIGRSKIMDHIQFKFYHCFPRRNVESGVPHSYTINFRLKRNVNYWGENYDYKQKC
jgi:hypothetical protein